MSSGHHKISTEHVATLHPTTLNAAPTPATAPTPSTTPPSSRPVRAPRDLDTCVICLDSVAERAIAVPCNHLQFDFLCLASWAQARDQPKCPLCNTHITAIEYDWRAPHDFKRYVLPRDINVSTRGGRGYARIRASRRPLGNARRAGRWSDQHGRFPHAVGARGEGRHPASSFDAGPDAMINRRRHIYTAHLSPLHIGSSRHSRFSTFTPTTFTKSPTLQSCARAFLRRELQVFDFSVQTREFLVSYCGSILKSVDLKSADQKAQVLMAEFLGKENAEMFWREAESWLRSPFERLEQWDGWVQYAGEDAGEALSTVAAEMRKDNDDQSMDRPDTPRQRPRHEWRGHWRDQELVRRYQPD